MKKFIRNTAGRACQLVGAGVAVCATAVNSFAQSTSDPVTGALTSLNGYWTTAEVLGAGILLFVVGRKIVKKI